MEIQSGFLTRQDAHQEYSPGRDRTFNDFPRGDRTDHIM